MGPPFSPHSAPHPNIQNMPEGASTHDVPHDNSTIPNTNASNHNPVTAIITTGPDGAPLDDASQQSTISNVSAGIFSIYYSSLFCN